MTKCKDCGVKNRSYAEYCVHCGAKLTKSHRSLHSSALPAPSFVLDVKPQ